MNKYHNKKTTTNGIEFDSKAEANFYANLKLLYPKSKIILQPVFELQPTFKYQHERLKIRSITYVADFQIGNIVIDVKGMQTEVFKIKAKLFKYKYPELVLLAGSNNEIFSRLKELEI